MASTSRLLRASLPAIAGLGVIFVASCASSPSPDSATSGSRDRGPGGPQSREPAEAPRPTIDGTWLVVAVERGGDRYDAPRAAGDDAVVIEFAGRTGARSPVSGYSGVNRFSGTYSHSPGELLVGAMWIADLISTRRAGPPEAMEFEAALLSVLERARSFVFDSNAGAGAVIESGGDRVILRRR